MKVIFHVTKRKHNNKGHIGQGESHFSMGAVSIILSLGITSTDQLMKREYHYQLTLSIKNDLATLATKVRLS